MEDFWEADRARTARISQYEFRGWCDHCVADTEWEVMYGYDPFQYVGDPAPKAYRCYECGKRVPIDVYNFSAERIDDPFPSGRIRRQRI